MKPYTFETLSRQTALHIMLKYNVHEYIINTDQPENNTSSSIINWLTKLEDDKMWCMLGLYWFLIVRNVYYLFIKSLT